MISKINNKPKTLIITLSPENSVERLHLLNFFQMAKEAVVKYDPGQNKPYGQIKISKTLK